MAVSHTLTAALVLLAALASAGCFGDGEAGPKSVATRAAPRRAAPEYSTDIERRLEERLTERADGAVFDWYVLAGSTGPAGNLTGFRFTIPLGAVTGMRLFQQTGLILEVAPIVVGNATISSWCLLAFRQAESKAILVGPTTAFGGPTAGLEAIYDEFMGVSCAAAEEVLVRDVIAGENRTQVPADVSPRFVILSDSVLKDLDNVFFVLAAASDVEAEFGLAFRLIQQYPTFQDQGPRTLDEFLFNVSALRPVAVPAIGVGNGFQASGWDAWYSITQSEEHRSGVVQAISPLVEGRPAAAVWNFNASASLESKGGWSYTHGIYSGLCSTGKWSAWAELNGNEFLARSLILQHPICAAIYPWIVELLLVGTAEYLFYGGGEGSSTSSYEVVVASGGQELFQFDHVAVGTRLDELIGLPAASARYAATGLAGNVPP